VYLSYIIYAYCWFSMRRRTGKHKQKSEECWHDIFCFCTTYNFTLYQNHLTSDFCRKDNPKHIRESQQSIYGPKSYEELSRSHQSSVRNIGICILLMIVTNRKCWYQPLDIVSYNSCSEVSNLGMSQQTKSCEAMFP